MFNKFFLVLLALLFLFSFTCALKIVSPIEAEVSLDSTVELGSISPGQSFELILFDERFNAIAVEGQFSEWSGKSTFYEKNTGIKINIPKDVSFGTKNLSFKAFDSTNKNEFQSFNVLIKVEEDLWSVAVPDLKNKTKVNFPAEYNLIFSNESIGEQKITLNSNLPVYWIKEQTFLVEPKSVLKDVINVVPKHYGNREFDFTFNSVYSNETKKLHSELSIESSIESKYSSPLYGFPFFTPTLFPYFLIESFLGFFLE